MIKEYSIHTAVLGSISFLIAYILNKYSPNIIEKTLGNNTIPILIGILAINIQVIAVISNRLNALMDKYKKDFKTTFIEIKKSIYEQCVLILLTFFGYFLASLENKIDSLLIETIFLFSIISSIKIFIDTTLAMLECLLLYPD